MMTALATAELKTIRVYGDLAKLLKQRTFKAAVRSPQDAIKFLLANFPEVESYILPRFFHIRVGEREIREDDLEAPTGVFEEIRIIPAICGAGGGVGQIITGVALIAGSFLVPFAAPVLLPLGIGLTLTGIATFLTPTPSDRPESTDPSDSYNFNGLQQTSREGIPVPVVYGEIFTGSVVLSVKVEEDDEELGAEFEAGEGNPNPDPNPVPDPDPDIDPADYSGGWRWYITIGTNGERCDPFTGIVLTGTQFVVGTSTSSAGEWVPYLSSSGFWTPNIRSTTSSGVNWVANATLTKTATTSSDYNAVFNIGKQTLTGLTSSYPAGTILYTYIDQLSYLFSICHYQTAAQGSQVSISGYFKLYKTAQDWVNDTDATVWQGYSL